MPYKISFSHDERLLLNRVYGNVSIQEVVEMTQIAAQCLRDGTFPIHIIVDTLDIGKYPTNIIQLKNIVSYLRHPNMGWFVSVGNNSMLNTMGTIIFQLLGMNFRTFRSVDDALDFLERVDTTLLYLRREQPIPLL